MIKKKRTEVRFFVSLQRPIGAFFFPRKDR